MGKGMKLRMHRFAAIQPARASVNRRSSVVEPAAATAGPAVRVRGHGALYAHARAGNMADIMKAPATPTNWQKLLRALNDELLDEAQGESDFCLAPEVYERVLAERWLGRPGASEAAIAAAEGRLGVALPADYRGFLAAANGWWGCVMFPNGLAQLLPVEEVRWGRDASSRSVAWVAEHFGEQVQGVDLLRDALVIGEGDGNEFTFLLPGGAPWAVCNWEHETGIELFPSFEALIRSYWSPGRAPA